MAIYVNDTYLYAGDIIKCLSCNSIFKVESNGKIGNCPQCGGNIYDYENK